MDIPVLRYVDVLIGLSLVMLLVATVAMAISQALLNMSASRARHLAGSLAPLIRQMDPAQLEAHAGAIARGVLLHPLVRQPRSPMSTAFHWLARLLRVKKVEMPSDTVPGTVILREELAMCLLERAAEEAPTPALDRQQAAAQGESDKPRLALAAALKRGGIEDPATTLKAVKLQALANEKDHPEQPAQLWRSQALTQCAPSEFLATLYQSFDTAMARASAAFAVEAQIWVCATALVILVIIQLDAFALIKRLSVDDRYRQALVEEAKRIDAATPAGTIPSLDVLSGASCESLAGSAREQCRINESLNLLHSPTFDLWPKTRSDWWSKLPGVVFAWLLVSLGAPFWYDLLKNLLKLRSLLAQKDDADRTQRNAAAAPPASAGAASPGTGAGTVARTGTAASAGAGTGTGTGNGTGTGSGASTPLGTTGAMAGGAAPDSDGEIGDLAATGAQG